MQAQQLVSDPYHESRMVTAVSVLLDFLEHDTTIKASENPDIGNAMLGAAAIIARGHGVDKYELSRRTVDEMARRLKLIP